MTPQPLIAEIKIQRALHLLLVVFLLSLLLLLQLKLPFNPLPDCQR